ncbi:MAG TPA: flagellar biosynthesis protein FlhB [Anaerovoracaceae bacterium]|nr:flagellar biosynthesis protein FlhB [Anaerovoracaceae bacterium]
MNKTEKATPKKRRDERKKGNAFQSKDIISIVVVIVGFVLISKLGRFISDQVKLLYIRQMGRAEGMHEITITTAMEIFRDTLKIFFISAIPIAMALALTGIIMTGVQTRFLVSADLLKFKFSRISIVQGMKRLMSLRSIVQLVKSIMKILVIMWIIYTSTKELLVVVPDVLNTAMDVSIEFMISKAMSMVFKICLFFVAVAILDFAYQKYDYEKKLRMTKQEVKDEYKQTEGDPFIKSRIRDKQRKISLNRMIQQVPHADVIVRNPTHYAVALKYDIDEDLAPTVVAKGQGDVARRIIQVAKNNNVLITEDKPLAQSLYKSVEIDDYIPAEFYQAVAEILAWVYNSKEKGSREWD